MKTKKPARLTFSAEDAAKSFEPAIKNSPTLPPVDWEAIGQSAPQLLNTPSGDLPKADAIVITWAEAEWAAAEHVFCNSSASMSYSSRNKGSWTGWEKYAKGIPKIPNDNQWTYWGYYRLVKIENSTVILFKSNTHLDYPGEKYLEQMITRLIETAKPQLILSIGTAGGARTDDHIGTVNVVHAGTLYESNEPQSEWPSYSNAWDADGSLIGEQAFNQLLFPIPTTKSDLQSLCSQFNSFYGTNYSLNQLNVNNLNMGDAMPAINNMTEAGTSLLTTDSFVVATSAGNLSEFACVEMDDAIIANVCDSHHTAFGFVRNISDPVQNDSLPPKVQGNWGSTIYDVYGLYTSYNGAIAAWAAIAASSGPNGSPSRKKLPASSKKTKNQPSELIMKAKATNHGPLKFGRLQRTYDPRIPHLSALLAGQTPAAPPPPSVDYTKGMPANLGMMLNATLGDCTCAAVYHAMQVWSFNAGGKVVTQPDSDVEKLYILACGYNPRVPGEGPGGNEQHVLTYWLQQGVPIGPQGATRQKITAFVEVDPRNVDDVKRTINDCGVAYIGFNVPQSVQPPGQLPPAVWNYIPNQSNIIGGHAVVLPGYTSQGPKVISWGQYYTMTWEFFAHFVDEVYGIADSDWIEAKGTTPGGLTLDELEIQMQALKQG